MHSTEKCFIAFGRDKLSSFLSIVTMFCNKCSFKGCNFLNFWKIWEVWKFTKSFLMLRMHYFCIFFKIINKPGVNFSRVWTKNNFLENLRSLKIYKKFLKKICSECIIFVYFSKYLTNHALIFCAFGRKSQWVGEILRNLWKYLKKIQ